MSNFPIGIFDSGCGGITVLNSVAKLLPHENITYVSDSRGSWGNLPEYKIFNRAYSCVELLLNRGCKIIVSACNTATGVGIHKLRQSFGVPLVGIEPAVKPALKAYGNRRITVFCTAATARQRNLGNLIGNSGVSVCVLPALAAEVERNLRDLSVLQDTVKSIARANPADAVVLGCTHYIYLRRYFEAEYGEGRVFDGNYGVAKRVKSLLTEFNLLNCGGEGVTEFYKI